MPKKVKKTSSRNRPLYEDPFAQEAFAQDPFGFAQGPVAQDPVAQDPVAQDPVVPEPVPEDADDGDEVETSSRAASGEEEEPLEATVEEQTSENSYPESKCTREFTSAYETPAIKIIVGAQRKVFWAHQHFLSKSPFFKRACEGSFSESTSREIRREDDDPLLFHHVLDYLYTSAWSPKILRDGDDAIGLEGRSEDKDVRTVECSRQAQLYCMADFYGLDNMMSQAIEKLKLLAPIPLENLLTIARRTHRRIPSSDTAFREFVRTEAYKLKIDRFKSTAWLSNHVQEGGLLTLDLFMALQRTSERHVKSLGNPARVPGCSEEDVYPTPEFYDDSVDREHIPVSDGEWKLSLWGKRRKMKLRHSSPSGAEV